MGSELKDGARTAQRPVVTAPRTIDWLTVELGRRPAPGTIRIRSRLSLISPGTELRLVRGEPMLRGVWEGFANLDCLTVPPFDPTYRVASTDGPSGPIFPAGLGYNTVGEVIAVADDVEGFAAGERVVTMSRHQDVFDLSAWEAWSVPAGVPEDDAVYAYIATLGLAALRKARYAVAENVAVVGLGLVGLCAALVADACGARLLGVDIHPARLHHARTVLPAATILDGGASELAAAVEAAFCPHGIDVVLEAGAGTESIACALRMAATGGRVAVIALHSEQIGALLGGTFNAREVELLGSANDPYADHRQGYPRFTLGGNVLFVLSLLARGRLTFRDVTSRRFRAADLAAAYAAMDAGQVTELGILLDWREGA